MITDKQEVKARIFDIQGLSVHDGPGCRTLVFMSGCTLDCYWCSNPEGINRNSSLLYFQRKCLLCGNCVKNCIKNAVQLLEDRIKINREICSSCEDQSCVDECYSGALMLSGYEISVPGLFQIIQRDRQFWGSEGGVTLTGGEPLLQIDFAEKFLEKCFHSYIHTAIETCGNIPWSNFERVIPYLDWIFFDIKNTDGVQHKNVTGADNSLILDNARRLAEDYPGRLMFRIPVIPGFNDADTNIAGTIAFLKDIGKKEINILPLHHLGKEKYISLNKAYLAETWSTPSVEAMKKMKTVFAGEGIDCYIGSETPF